MSEIRQRVDAEQAEYARDAQEERPLVSYAGLLGVYGAGVAGLAALMVAAGRRIPERISISDLALTAVATHRVSRTLAKDPVTSPLRAPFTRFKGTAGPAELAEETRGRGIRKAIGELITCPFCLAQWAATGFIGGLLVAPRATRAVAAVFAVVAASDTLQLGYAALEKRAGG